MTCYDISVSSINYSFLFMADSIEWFFYFQSFIETKGTFQFIGPLHFWLLLQTWRCSNLPDGEPVKYHTISCLPVVKSYPIMYVSTYLFNDVFVILHVCLPSYLNLKSPLCLCQRLITLYHVECDDRHHPTAILYSWE